MSNDVGDAIGRAFNTLVKAIVYALVFIPLGLLCLVAAVLFIPLDVVALAFSGGKVQFAIFGAFRDASESCFSWFRDNI